MQIQLLWKISCSETYRATPNLFLLELHANKWATSVYFRVWERCTEQVSSSCIWLVWLVFGHAAQRPRCVGVQPNIARKCYAAVPAADIGDGGGGGHGRDKSRTELGNTCRLLAARSSFCSLLSPPGTFKWHIWVAETDFQVISMRTEDKWNETNLKGLYWTTI